MLNMLSSRTMGSSLISTVTMSLVLGLGLAIVPLSTEKAFASGGATDIGTTSESTVEDTAAATKSSNTGTCAQSLPAAPVRYCGYMSFGARVHSPHLAFHRAVSGAPQAQWQDSSGRTHLNNYKGQCQGEWIPIYDPTLDPATGANHAANKPANSHLWSIGVWWRDNQYYVPKTITESKWSHYNPRWKYSTKKTKKTITLPFPPFKFTYTVTETVRELNDPKRVLVRVTRNTIEGFTQRDYTTIGPGGSANGIQTLTFPWYTNRIVDYGGCNYPKAPKLYTNVCAASVGPGYLTGPYGNSATSPWPVPTGVGKYDPQTELKRWNTRPANASSNPLWKETGGGRGILYSNIGMAWENPDVEFLLNRTKIIGSSATAGISGTSRWSGFFPSGSALAGQLLSYIKDCPDIVYQVSARDQSCVYLGSTFGADYGKTFGPRSEYCSKFTPGNYTREATGRTMKCQYAEVFWDNSTAGNRGSGYGETLNPKGDPVFKRELLGCDEPKLDPSAEIDGWSHWVCNDSRGSVGRNNSYNFANCSGPRPDGTVDIADEYRCVAPDAGEPRVLDPETGFVGPNRSQVLASGKQVQVLWPAPTGISVFSGGRLSHVGTPENMWQQWGLIPGSKPINDSLSLDDPNQSIFGNYLEGRSPDSSRSVIGGPGKDGWDTPWLYLRAYKAAGINNSDSSIRIGDETVAPGGGLPLGLTTTFNATIEKTVSTGLGGSITINVPISCDMPEAYLYVISGRATD